jgi:KaiC/GvpD/RAD55 family RecA-like ATPase
MSINPFPELEPNAGPALRAAPAAPFELATFPDSGYAGFRDEAPWPRPETSPLWAKPRQEPVQAVRPRVPVGLRPLDEFLGGGLPGGSTLAVVGPPFGGKRTLACHFLAGAIAAGTPALGVVTDGDVNQWRQALGTLSARIPEERRGLACIVDAGLGARDGHDLLPFPDRVLAAATDACRALASDRRRVVLDSFTTVAALSGFPAAFGMLARLVASLRREGATTLVLLEAGAHSPIELQLVKRQCDGAIEFRQYGGAPELQVTGLGLAGPSPWLQGRSESGPVQVPMRA